MQEPKNCLGAGSKTDPAQAVLFARYAGRARLPCLERAAVIEWKCFDTTATIYKHT